jgi:hypothetical protein
MKFLSKAVLIFFALFFSQPLVAEWKTSGWKAGDTVWFISKKQSNCHHKYTAWKIDGINNDVAKLIRKSDNYIKHRELSEIRGYSTEKSAKANIEIYEQKCKQDKHESFLKEKYENS